MYSIKKEEGYQNVCIAGHECIHMCYGRVLMKLPLILTLNPYTNYNTLLQLTQNEMIPYSLLFL